MVMAHAANKHDKSRDHSELLNGRRPKADARLIGDILRSRDPRGADGPQIAEASAEVSRAASTMANNVARAAAASYEQRTGRAPRAVTVVLVGQRLEVTVHEANALSEEARSLDGEPPRTLAEAIGELTGADVREIAAAEPAEGRAGHPDTPVQIFLLAERRSANAGPGSAREPDAAGRNRVWPKSARSGASTAAKADPMSEERSG
jgi:hypothetical protein